MTAVEPIVARLAANAKPDAVPGAGQRREQRVEPRPRAALEQDVQPKRAEWPASADHGAVGRMITCSSTTSGECRRRGIINACDQHHSGLRKAPANCRQHSGEQKRVTDRRGFENSDAPNGVRIGSSTFGRKGERRDERNPDDAVQCSVERRHATMA